MIIFTGRVQIMKRILFCAIAVMTFSGVAFADGKPTDAEAVKIKEALAAWGCSGGEIEKETEATSMFEVDDAKCKGGQFDIKLDSKFGVSSITRD